VLDVPSCTLGLAAASNPSDKMHSLPMCILQSFLLVACPCPLQLGIGLRSNFAACQQLMDGDLLGTRRFAVVRDDFDQAQVGVGWKGSVMGWPLSDFDQGQVGRGGGGRVGGGWAGDGVLLQLS
jgi:hypothetical protein